MSNAKFISINLTKQEAWAVLRALAIANSVPAEHDAHRDEKNVRTWVADRILNKAAREWNTPSDLR